MLVPEDLGFCVAAFFIFVVFPAIGFIIRRKWRLVVARKEEINQLLVLASEEAARAELEATIDYTAAVLAPLYCQCPVGFVPASNHCARCKSVHYWSRTAPSSDSIALLHLLHLLLDSPVVKFFFAQCHRRLHLARRSPATKLVTGIRGIEGGGLEPCLKATTT